MLESSPSKLNRTKGPQMDGYAWTEYKKFERERLTDNPVIWYKGINNIACFNLLFFDSYGKKKCLKK